MGKPQPLERQWLILRTLSARRYGATVRELADEHEVSQKTIRRDLSLLQKLSFPLSSKTSAHGTCHWFAESDNGTPPLTFNISELLALYMARSLLDPLAGTVFWESAQSAFRKIKATLGESSLAYIGQLAKLIHRTSFRSSDYSENSELIDNLMVAIEDRRIVFITYQSARSTEPLTYDVHPFGMVYHRGSLYLIAHSQQHGSIRNFKLDRISDVTLESLVFQKPPDFDLSDYLQHSLGIFRGDGPLRRVVIRFAHDVAQYVEEHRWHSSQKLSRLPDGQLNAEFKLADLEEIKAWVLSFGSKAVVVEPPELVDQITNELNELLDQYQAIKPDRN